VKLLPFEKTPKHFFANEGFSPRYENYLKDEANSCVQLKGCDEELDEDHISWRTSLGYLSGVEEAICRKVDDDSVTVQDKEFFINLKMKPPFLTEIRSTMKKHMIRHCIKKGVPITLKLKSCTRKDLILGAIAPWNDKG